MYLPAHFEESDIDVMLALIREHPIGALVTQDADGLHADHLPLLHEPGGSARGRLIGHVARNNELWRRAGSSDDSLVIFQGPSAYVSPSWYPTKRETHQVVPTYNYAVVHAYGPLIVHDDVKWLRGVVGKLTKTMESAQSTPWKMADAPAEYIDSQLANIVGIELPIARLVGKWKVSQNRPPADRQGAVDGMRASGAPDQMAMSELIAARSENR